MNRREKSITANYTKAIVRLVFFSLLWVLLTNGELSSWVIGIVVVPFAAWLNLRFFIPQHQVVSDKKGETKSYYFSLFRLLRLLPYFLMNSLKGGIQTSRLAFRRKSLTTSGLVRYSVNLPQGEVRLWFIHLISLLPGTLSARIEGDELAVHMLEVSSNNVRDITQCEEKIAFLFGLDKDKATWGKSK
ncbi:Na+/H+ antiporter subunit E [Pseudoalteromonas sp. Isolate6]|uniref:Na+/H+ antiporter subunit E n=1 Tax=Pseudoalteromonas sp. Isolate6 TaxID=2908527 RepID=UPI001EFD093F|nr:Na+/H+ antiporter subunit E [Pseudoalteromonas sp. Isolate6]MCG9760012.1 Na+/H+ antiporter subunit E [Pseudoalteromonas sp. Isolate6]